jgi:DNA-binding GntR family transcriptional regulator
MDEGGEDDPRKYVRVYRVLSREITGGEIDRGTKLNIGSLSDRFNVSRDTIKHALNLLAADELAKRFPGVGWVALTPRR